jgi:hypothetical protein
MRTKAHEANEAAYRQLEVSIKSRYPHGHFVAIDGGEVVGDASEFMTLYSFLKSTGRDPAHVLIVQAGHVYPDYAVIFLRNAK